MAFQISPGVNITEIDRTGVVAQVSTTIGGFAGDFRWGPVNEITTIDSENTLVARFGKPDPGNYLSFFSAANFLGYGSALTVVRAADSAAKLATRSGGKNANTLWNQKLYDTATNYGNSAASGFTGIAVAKYPGLAGNSLKISYSDNFERGITFAGLTTIAGLPNGFTFNSAGTEVAIGITGETDAIGAANFAKVAAGDYLRFADANGGNKDFLVKSLTERTGSGGIITLSISGVTASVATLITGKTAATAVWAYAQYAPYYPGTSSLAALRGYTSDEIAGVVIDEDGMFSGTPGTVLEGFVGSKSANAILADGSNNYYVNKINESPYVAWISHPETGEVTANDVAFGGTFALIGGAGSFATLKANIYGSLTGATDPTPAAGDIQTAYDEFADTDNVDVSLLLQGAHNSTVAKYIIDLADTRKDCVAFVSPDLDDVKDKTSSAALNNVLDFKRNVLNKNTSYAVLDSGWKYQYDKYHDTYRWMPLNPDVAGLCARTDNLTDPWFSPAGYNRGQIRNVIKLAFNPVKAERDALYANNINPVISQAGQGTLLFGDKTLLSKPSAFDRINVRRLFIVLEKAVATAAKFQLFEFNDEFTRANFLGIVVPFLRDVVARRGITEFKVICDETNNTAEVIDRNQFVADIYIKPNRSINFIQLNFIATRSNAQFNEIGPSINI